MHQGATITKFEKPSISNDMLWPLLLNIFGFAFFFGSVTLTRFRTAILQKEGHRPWFSNWPVTHLNEDEYAL
ncbi:cytochrome c-type biogenesis protein ccmC [Vibrio sp. JCM 19236]|nr:cytochrome c-type biogenesis protein ccmC [Vibrio sp. JCM 19236]